MTLPVLAIVGRPNVGKSTLFNRLIGFQKAVVHDRPGVTRDRLYEEAEILGHQVLVIDTGGLEPDPDTDLLAAMRLQSLVAVEEADVILFLVDGRAGFTPPDADVADLLRRSDKPVLLVVNKIDGPRHEDLGADFYQVGIDPMITVSAAHGRGVYELHEAVAALLPEREVVEEDAEIDGVLDDDGEEKTAFSGPIRIAVIGRPNIGKSTLINQILGENRHLVHDSPGTTMDPVDSAVQIGDREYVLVDTAGVRRRSKIDDKLERWVSLRSIRAIERCHVTLLMIDGTEGPTEQDAKLASLVKERGRALVLLINKWDLVKDLEDVDAHSTEDGLEHRMPHAPWAPHLFISAKTGKGLQRIIPMVEAAFAEFNHRVGTPALNRFLEQILLGHSPPQKHHRPVRLLYMAQTRVRPPTFAISCNSPDGIGIAYKRYIERRLREKYGFEGTPLRLQFKQRRKPGQAKED